MFVTGSADRSVGVWDLASKPLRNEAADELEALAEFKMKQEGDWAFQLREAVEQEKKLERKLDNDEASDDEEREAMGRPARGSESESINSDDLFETSSESSELSDGDLLELPADVPDRNDADGGGGGFAPAMVLEALRARGLRRILVECGGVTVSRFLQAGELTRLHVTVAPMLIGSGRHALTLPPIASLDQALRPRCHLFHLGDDVLFDLALR